MLELNNKDLEIYKANLNKRKKTFTVERKRGDKFVVVNGRKVAKLKRNNSISFLDKNDSKSIISLFGSVKKSVNRYIVKSNFNLTLINKVYNSVFTNRPLFDTLPIGTVFYYVDVKHCYWRIAYLRGYITKYYYDKILENPDLKLYRNMALSCIIAPKQVEYFKDGYKTHEMIEDMTMYDTIYQNIRHYAWNLFGRLAFERIGKERCIGYFTDGIMIFKEDLQIVKTTLARQKLQHRTIVCKKTAHREYIYIEEGEIRRI